MLIYLIRHGEVYNPNHVVYADLPGFTLSEHGERQAQAVAARLADTKLAAIVSSPLERAVATAFAISAVNGAAVSTVAALTEWQLSSRWAGVAWEALPEVFPGELEAYLQDPQDLQFSPESLDDLARRIGSVVCDWVQRNGSDGIAFVSHQDPIHSASRLLTGTSFANYHTNKPEHCSVLTLESTGGLWTLADYWAPQQ